MLGHVLHVFGGCGAADGVEIVLHDQLQALAAWLIDRKVALQHVSSGHPLEYGRLTRCAKPLPRQRVQIEAPAIALVVASSVMWCGC